MHDVSPVTGERGTSEETLQWPQFQTIFWRACQVHVIWASCANGMFIWNYAKHWSSVLSSINAVLLKLLTTSSKWSFQKLLVIYSNVFTFLYAWLFRGAFIFSDQATSCVNVGMSHCTKWVNAVMIKSPGCTTVNICFYYMVHTGLGNYSWTAWHSITD